MDHKNSGGVLIKVAMVLFAFTIFVTGTVEAKQFKIQNGDFSGSFLTSKFKFEYGEETVSTTATGKANLGGKFTSHTITQFQFASSTEFFVEESRAVISNELGQLYLYFVPGVDTSEGLIDDSGGLPVFQLTVTYHIVGGSGNFMGAEGSLISTSTGVLLASEFVQSDYNQFGGVEGSIEGSFSTPD